MDSTGNGSFGFSSAAVGGAVGREVVLLGEVLVDAAGHSRGYAPLTDLAARQHHHYHQFVRSGLIERPEPAHVRGVAIVGAGAGLAQDRLVRIVGGAASGAVVGDRFHAALEIGDPGAELELPLDSRHQVGRFVLSAGILQVVERAAVGDGGKQRCQFERRQRDAGTEAGHHAHAFRRRRFGQHAGLLGIQIERRLLAQTEQLGVVRNPLESQLSAQRRKVGIVRVGQRLRQVQTQPPRQEDRRVRLHDAFAHGRQRGYQLDGGAGLKPLCSASFWLTMLRIRPLVESTTTTLPL